MPLKDHTFSRNTRGQLVQVFDALRNLTTPPEPPKRPIGFVQPAEKWNKPAAKAASNAAAHKKSD